MYERREQLFTIQYAARCCFLRSCVFGVVSLLPATLRRALPPRMATSDAQRTAAYSLTLVLCAWPIGPATPPRQGVTVVGAFVAHLVTHSRQEVVPLLVPCTQASCSVRACSPLH